MSTAHSAQRTAHGTASGHPVPAIFTMVVWGESYATLFLEVALRALLDPTNLPAARGRSEFLLLTDNETLPQIARHPRIQQLRSVMPVKIERFRAEGDLYAQRYGLQAALHRKCMQTAIPRNAACVFLGPDSTYGQHFVPNLLARLDVGHDAVIGVAMRAAAEPMVPCLTISPGAPTADHLYTLAHANLHPLWLASYWRAPRFTRMPYTILWGDTETRRHGDTETLTASPSQPVTASLVARSFALMPYAVVPTEAMLEGDGVIDSILPSLVANPYYAHDWSEFPACGVEYLFCWYPPFGPGPADPREVAAWAQGAMDPRQHVNLRHIWRYPGGDGNPGLTAESDEVVQQIVSAMADGTHETDATNGTGPSESHASPMSHTSHALSEAAA
jgi:hypothetical protein